MPETRSISYYVAFCTDFIVFHLNLPFCINNLHWLNKRKKIHLQKLHNKFKHLTSNSMLSILLQNHNYGALEMVSVDQNKWHIWWIRPKKGVQRGMLTKVKRKHPYREFGPYATQSFKQTLNTSSLKAISSNVTFPSALICISSQKKPRSPWLGKVKFCLEKGGMGGGGSAEVLLLYNLFRISNLSRRYMAEILPIRRKTLSNQSINQSINITCLSNH